ncbi:type II toxin-antitoxin system HicB family antitoxin [Pseudonocardiaceae bacterium YIM PH 21723]|nr:type II toxin-antitoxin system HicB family antitoxin [Pseudonocardiaceae bacterium YIM PH 21723]
MSGYVAVVRQRDDGGYTSWSPDLPGCTAAGDTFEECVRLMREAVSFHLDSLRQKGLSTPPPTAVAAVVIQAPSELFSEP